MTKKKEVLVDELAEATMAAQEKADAKLRAAKQADSAKVRSKPA